MKIVSINRDICIGCGMCTAISDDGLASVKIPNGELTNADDEDVAEQAKDACPSGAIEIEEK